jgi:hypothetical protein
VSFILVVVDDVEDVADERGDVLFTLEFGDDDDDDDDDEDDDDK